MERITVVATAGRYISAKLLEKYKLLCVKSAKVQIRLDFGGRM